METKRLKTIRGLTDRRIDALLTLLSENSTIVISGAKIAQEIGVSRGTVWRWVQKLRALGVNVSGHPRTGYHIDRMPDILAPKLISRQLVEYTLLEAHLPFSESGIYERYRDAAGR